MTERRDPYLDALEQLNTMRDRAFKAEDAVRRVREVCDLWQRRHDSSIRHPSDIPAIAIAAVLRALDGER